MNRSERIKTGEDAAMPQEIASAVNLLAHPMAGAAAMGAIGFGLAGHTLGIWLGAWAGVAGASQRAFGDTFDEPAQKAVTPAPPKPAASKPAVQKRSARAAKVAAKPAGTARPAGIDKPASPDDFKAISGVGPKLEKVLNGLGIWTYGQIAALDTGEMAWLDEHLGLSGRIARDDWVGQARALSAGA